MHIAPLPTRWRLRPDGGRTAVLVPGKGWIDAPPLAGGEVRLRLSARRARHPGLLLARLPQAADWDAQTRLLDGAVGTTGETLRQAVRLLLRLSPQPPDRPSTTIRLSGGGLRWETLEGPQTLSLPRSLVRSLRRVGGIGGSAFPWTIARLAPPASAHERLALLAEADRLLADAGVGPWTRAAVAAQIQAAA